MMSSFRLSDENGIAAAAVVKTEMEKLLECKVGIKIPVPPIYICETGHSICQNCKPKLKECAICKKPYTNSVNFDSEAMVQTAKFYCNHRHKGCTFTGILDELINHNTICTFRPVKCFLNGKNDCNGNVVYMSEYVDHLKNVHKLNPFNEGGKKYDTFAHGYSSSDWNEGKLQTNRIWEPRLINYDGKWFITRLIYRDPLFFVRCMLIGEETEAVDFAVNISIHSETNAMVPKFSLTTIVESLRTVTENTEKLPRTAIPKDLMGRLGTVTLDGTGAKKMKWRLKYKITKL